MFERAEVVWWVGAECLSVQLYSATPVSPHITTTRRDTDRVSLSSLWPWPGNITTTLSQWTITSPEPDIISVTLCIMFIKHLYNECMNYDLFALFCSSSGPIMHHGKEECLLKYWFSFLRSHPVVLFPRSESDCSALLYSVLSINMFITLASPQS